MSERIDRLSTDCRLYGCLRITQPAAQPPNASSPTQGAESDSRQGAAPSAREPIWFCTKHGGSDPTCPYCDRYVAQLMKLHGMNFPWWEASWHEMRRLLRLWRDEYGNRGETTSLQVWDQRLKNALVATTALLVEVDNAPDRGLAAVPATQGAALTKGEAHPVTAHYNSMKARSWPEDEGTENGNYEGTCASCNGRFFGHKRRAICKPCASAPKQGEDSALREGVAARLVQKLRNTADDMLTNLKDWPRGKPSASAWKSPEPPSPPPLETRRK